jgi:SAM-dependent methyltransferase
MGILQNCCKPKGLAGKFVVKMMNNGHIKLAAWGFSHIIPDKTATVLDAGCGGGANVSVWLKKCSQGKVTGLDYSNISVENSKKLNKKEIAKGRCNIIQGDVAKMPFEDNSFQYVSAFETIYFWPGLEPSVKEVYRVLKNGGTFYICNEADGTVAEDEKWTRMIDGMTIFKEAQITENLQRAGFVNIKADHNEKHWLFITAMKKL